MPPKEFNPDSAAQHDGIYGLPCTPEDSMVVLIPVPWEATVSYRAGTAKGPAAILEASRQVELFDRDTGEPWRAGIAMLPEDPEIAGWNEAARRAAEPVIAAGEVGEDRALIALATTVNRLGARMNDRVSEIAGRWLDAGKLVGLVGGDHSTPFGLIRALAEREPGFGILHLDAHADLRDAYEGFTWSHASIMFNVCERIPGVTRLVQAGIRDFGRGELDYILANEGKIVTGFDADYQRARLAGKTLAAYAKPLLATLPERVYLSFDIDGLDPKLCPTTGTPVPGGFSFAEAVELIRLVVASGRRIIGFDLNEVAPGADEWDANVGARLLYKQIGYALASGKHAPKSAAKRSKSARRR